MEKSVRCPNCAFRIVYKTRNALSKTKKRGPPKRPLRLKLVLQWDPPANARLVQQALAPELNRVGLARAKTAMSVKKDSLVLDITGSDWTAIRAAWNSKLKAMQLIHELQGIPHGNR